MHLLSHFLCLPELSPAQQILALVLLGFGAVFSFIFHIGIKERSGDDPLLAPSPDEDAPPVRVLQWKHWLKEPSFYQVTAPSLILACSAMLNCSFQYDDTFYLWIKFSVLLAWTYFWAAQLSIGHKVSFGILLLKAVVGVCFVYCSDSQSVYRAL